MNHLKPNQIELASTVYEIDQDGTNVILQSLTNGIDLVIEGFTYFGYNPEEREWLLMEFIRENWGKAKLFYVGAEFVNA